MFDLTWDKPKPLVPRRHRLEVVERIAADGSVVEPLNEASVVAAGEQLVAAGIEAVAICLINSYRNPAHEQRVEAILRERFPELLVTASYAVLPERKEYERTSTTVVNAYLLGAMRSYLQQPRDRPALHRHRRADPRDHLQRRHAGGGDRLREAGVRGGLGPGRRRDRRGAAGRGARRARPHRVRHGRHDGQGRHHRGRPAEHDVGIRVPRRHLDVEPLRQGRRLHAQGAGHRHRRGRRRRRLAGGHRQGRAAQGRAGVGRRRAGPGLLRPRQRAPDRDGCQRRAGPDQPALAGRRPARHRPAPERAGDPDARGQAARPHAGGCRARHPRRRQRRHVARHPRRHRRARPRSARPDADRHRRQRRHPRARRGARSRHRPRGGAAARRRVQRGRHAGLRPRAHRARHRHAPPRRADERRSRRR